MYNRFYRIISRVFSSLYGKFGLQKFFKALFYISLDGLNYGKVHDAETDGEKWLIRKIYYELKLLPEPATIFDVGANRGDYTLMIQDVFRNKRFEVHLFEPGSKVFRQLTGRLTGGNLIFNPAGLGEAKAKVTLHVPRKKTDMASIHIQMEDTDSEEVELITLDDYCKGNKVRHIHLLKLDVEGNELACLKGAREMLKDHRISFIQFEFGKSNIHSRVFFRDIFTLLDGYRYDIFRLVKNGLVPLRQYHHSMEIFYTTNYFARKRDEKA